MCNANCCATWKKTFSRLKVKIKLTHDAWSFGKLLAAAREHVNLGKYTQMIQAAPLQWHVMVWVLRRNRSRFGVGVGASTQRWKWFKVLCPRLCLSVCVGACSLCKAEMAIQMKWERTKVRKKGHQHQSAKLKWTKFNLYFTIGASGRTADTENCLNQEVVRP